MNKSWFRGFGVSQWWIGMVKVAALQKGLSKSNVRSFHWRNFSEYLPQAKGVESSLHCKRRHLHWPIGLHLKSIVNVGLYHHPMIVEWFLSMVGWLSIIGQHHPYLLRWFLGRNVLVTSEQPLWGDKIFILYGLAMMNGFWLQTLPLLP